MRSAALPANEILALHTKTEQTRSNNTAKHEHQQKRNTTTPHERKHKGRTRRSPRRQKAEASRTSERFHAAARRRQTRALSQSNQPPSPLYRCVVVSVVRLFIGNLKKKTRKKGSHQTFDV